jgi:hypothetical protein
MCCRGLGIGELVEAATGSDQEALVPESLECRAVDAVSAEIACAGDAAFAGDSQCNLLKPETETKTSFEAV